jgi:molecular chaperone GrpE (heat shock protein)
MTKTLSQLRKQFSIPKGEVGTTAYYPKNQDEKDFVDKHTIEMIDDANGNGDEVFKGTGVKAIDRKSERHGYDSPEDQKVHEEREMSSSEMKKREDIVKGMKKNVSSFKQRYGKDAESVMYATATKMAKEDALPKFDSILEAVEYHQEEQEYFEAISMVIEAVYESLDAEDKVTMMELMESDDGIDTLIEAAEEILED